MLNISQSVIRSESKCFELIQENENLPKHNLNKIIAELSKTIGSNQNLPLIDCYLVGRVKTGLGKTDYSGIAGAIKKFAHSFVNWFKLGEFTTTDKYIDKLQEKTNPKRTDDQKIINDLTAWAKRLTPGNKEEAIKRILTALSRGETAVDLAGLGLEDVPYCRLRVTSEIETTQPIKSPKKENPIPTKNVKITNSSKIKYPNSRELFEWSEKMYNKPNRKEVFKSIKRGDPKLDLSTFKLEEFPPLDLDQLSRIKTIEHKDLKELFEWTKKGDPKNKIQAFLLIYNCARNQKTELNISNLNLTELPSLKFLSKVKTLNVMGNKLPEKEIDKLNTELKLTNRLAKQNVK